MYVKSITCDLDIQQLKLLSVNYLISTAVVSNAKEIGLQKWFTEDDPDSYYKFIIYKIL